MPTITINPISVSKSPILQIAVKQCMIEFATNIMIHEMPVVSPNEGYKAYDKRMALAKQVIQNPDLYVEMATRLVATIYPAIEYNNQANICTATRAVLVSDNNKGDNFMKFQVIYNDYDNTGGTVGEIGTQLWDSLAGLIASDLPIKA